MSTTRKRRQRAFLGSLRVALPFAGVAWIGVAACSSPTDPSLPTGELEMTIDRSEYRMGDSIVVVVRSIDGRYAGPLDRFGCLIGLERKDADEGWTAVYTTVHRACIMNVGGEGSDAVGRYAYLIGVGSVEGRWPREDRTAWSPPFTVVG